MSYRCLFPVLFVSILVISLGCSSGGTRMVTAPDDSQAPRQPEANSHYLWGFYQVTIDPDAKSMEFAVLRSGELHLNALHFLEPPPA